MASHYTTAQKAEKRRQKAYIKGFKSIQKTPPVYLSSNAKKVYKKLFQFFMDDQIKEQDLPLFCEYCETVSQLIDLNQQIAKEGYIIKGKTSPAARARIPLLTYLTRLSNCLCLNPSERARLAIKDAKTNKKDDPLLRVLKND